MQRCANVPYADLQVGQKARVTRTVDQDDIVLFAAVSGDRNPIHLDAEFARSSLFRKRVAHGMLSGAFIGAAIAHELPGPGTIYLSQQLEFTGTVSPGDVLRIELEIVEKMPKRRVRIATSVYNQDAERVVNGEAIVLAPKDQLSVSLPELPPIVIG